MGFRFYGGRRSDPPLRRLDVSHNRLLSSGAACMGFALHSNCSLIELLLDSNGAQTLNSKP